MAVELGQTASATSSGVPHALRVHGIEYDLTALQGLAQSYPAIGAHGHVHSPITSTTSNSNSHGDSVLRVESVQQTSSAGTRTTVAHGGQLGATGSLAWQGEIVQLKGCDCVNNDVEIYYNLLLTMLHYCRTLRELGEQIVQLETEQNRKIAEVKFIARIKSLYTFISY